MQNGRSGWRVRPDREISSDLGKSYGIPVELASKMSGIAAVARALERGDLVHAQIATLLLEFPDPPNVIESRSELSDIVELAKALRASELLSREWDPAKHPRWPAHSPDGVGGQFAPSNGSQGAPEPRAAITQAQVTIPFRWIFRHPAQYLFLGKQCRLRSSRPISSLATYQKTHILIGKNA
jgi:hypothetical protein